MIAGLVTCTKPKSELLPASVSVPSLSDCWAKETLSFFLGFFLLLSPYFDALMDDLPFLLFLELVFLLCDGLEAGFLSLLHVGQVNTVCPTLPHS